MSDYWSMPAGINAAAAMKKLARSFQEASQAMERFRLREKLNVGEERLATCYGCGKDYRGLLITQDPEFSSDGLTTAWRIDRHPQCISITGWTREGDGAPPRSPRVSTGKVPPTPYRFRRVVTETDNAEPEDDE